MNTNQWFVAATIFGFIGILSPRLSWALVAALGGCAWIDWTHGIVWTWG